MTLDNDTRGWIMTAISGGACIFGACFICVDLLIRLFRPSSRFQVESSNVFLSASLSLTFGVMLFSSLYGTLPEASTYFKNAGYNPTPAGFLTVGFFILGAGGIQLLTGWLHRFIPNSIVDCDEEHDEGEEDHVHESNVRGEYPAASGNEDKARRRGESSSSENTPLIDGDDGDDLYRPQTTQADGHRIRNGTSGTTGRPKKPSMHRALSSRLGKMMPSMNKSSCDTNGPCFGFVDSCGAHCYRDHGLKGEGGQKYMNGRPRPSKHRQGLPRTVSSPMTSHPAQSIDSPGRQIRQEHANHAAVSTRRTHKPASSHDHSPSRSRRSSSSDLEANDKSHHHHVPQNAFLSIGLQTSIAIALHKLPEGFITYATNHANPSLGLSIFLALSIHNLTEGFAMALPLFLALRSRPKAILWSSLLGGVSQPAGAGVAAIWLSIADKSGSNGHGPGDGVYGGLFAVTSGILCSVALGLFSESLSMHQNRTLCFSFAFIGMGILGVSFALTAK